MRLTFLAIRTIALLGLCSSIHAQKNSGDVDSNVQNSEQVLLKGHVAWGSKLSSGASIQAKEIERQGTSVKYHLFISGLPPDALYSVVTWPVTQQKPAPVIEGANLGKNGIVMCAGRTQEQCGDPSRKDDPIDFAFNAAKGEPYRIAVVSGENRAAIVIVPNPISGKDKGCSFSVERLLPHFELAYFSGTGFRPNSEIIFDSQSFSEKHSVKTKSDGDGNIQFALMPFVTGHPKGTATVKAEGMPCSPSLKFDWGN